MFQTALSRALRVTGKGLDKAGMLFEMNPHIERLQPSMRNAPLGKRLPKNSGSFVAPSASVVGDVSIGEHSSVWYNAVLRGDVSDIKIGDCVTVGDRAMIHSSGQTASIGNRVLIGAGANIHGCTLQDECKVGRMATVLDNATVQKHAVVADGAVVTPGTVVKTRELWSGNPAKFERDLTSVEISKLAFEVAESVEMAVAHAEECAKDWRQIEEEEEIREENEQRNPFYYQRMSEDIKSSMMGETEGHAVPGRIFNSDLSGYNDPETRNGFYKSDTDDREEYFRRLHNTTKEPSLKYKMRELKRQIDEEEAEKAKKAEESK